jgi:hypothetical protein
MVSDSSKAKNRASRSGDARFFHQSSEYTYRCFYFFAGAGAGAGAAGAFSPGFSGAGAAGAGAGAGAGFFSSAFWQPMKENVNSRVSARMNANTFFIIVTSFCFYPFSG